MILFIFFITFALHSNCMVLENGHVRQYEQSKLVVKDGMPKFFKLFKLYFNFIF
jgi:hypothetical protein